MEVLKTNQENIYTKIACLEVEGRSCDKSIQRFAEDTNKKSGEDQ